MKSVQKLKKPLVASLLVSTMVVSCMKLSPSGTSKDDVLTIRIDPAEARAQAKQIREKATVKLADGLKLDLWASDSLSPDPVAMDIDDMGRVYINRTNRQKNSEFDIRGHRNWIPHTISWETVEDRRKFLHEFFAPEKSKENSWLKDLNGDGSHDWRDLAVEKDEVWRIEDTSGSGVADKATRVVNDFFDEITDVAGGVLVRAKDMFITIAPDVWRLWDTNGDGIYDKKESISHGYAVHVGFSGHGMSNPIEGPDGKIYWNIGDIGANVTSKEGVNYKHSNEGVIGRSNPDGSEFEIFGAGLRNTHEFVFDDYGNLISSDNDGDHPGEKERLVHVIEGHDAGWRSNWQYGKYTDPKNNGYKVWMDEKLSVPRWDGQAAYILPPIQNFHNGPTGMVYNPGTALGSKWKNKFFLVEFTGSPARSPIWAFGLKPKGASFVLDGEEEVLRGLLPTGIRFGPDGALYAADWVNGWDTKDYGRVWKLDVTDAENDLKELRAKTKQLIQLNYSKQTGELLNTLLFNPDQRVRRKAQFELAARGQSGLPFLLRAVEQKETQLARIHGIWGIGQLARIDKGIGQHLLPLLKDGDPEIVAQAAKVIGDERVTNASGDLIPLLKSSNPRVQFFAAQALGRLKSADAVNPLLQLIKANQDEDLYIRHAAVLALSRIGQVDPIAALYSNPDRSLRIAAVLVLRRMSNEKVSLFLNDKDEYIVTEAARAINDDYSIPAALPALANVLKETRFTSEPLLRRAINAALRVGSPEQIDLVTAFAKRSDVVPALRVEAIATLSSWADPSPLDRVDGRYRGPVKRDLAVVKGRVAPSVASLLGNTDPGILVATSQMVSELGISESNNTLASIFNSSKDAVVRAATLTALNKLKYADIESAMKKGMSDESAEVRSAALSLLSTAGLSAMGLAEVSKGVFEKGSVKEQQQLLKVFNSYSADKTTPILEGLVTRLTSKQLSPEIALELSEAVEGANSESLKTKLAALKPKENTLADYMDALYGGNIQAGRQYFLNNSSGECTRCHSLGKDGATVGPNLAKIGGLLSREQLLQALIEPSARLAPGFGMVILTLKDGSTASGILSSENEHELVLKTSEAEPLKIAVGRIAKRDNVPSAMPAMGHVMNKREIRDVVEFLANLK